MVLVNRLIAEIRMKVNPAKDIIQINGKIIKKFTFMLNTLLAYKPKIKITTFYNPQKQKAILDFLHNRFQKRSFLIRRIDFLRRVISSFKNEDVIYHQGGDPKFHYKKKYIVKMNSLKGDKKLIKWRNEIKLYYKSIHPYSIKAINQKIEYIIFKVIFNEGKNRQFIGKFNLLGYKFLDLKVISFAKISLGRFKEGDLKLFHKFIFKDIEL